MGRLQHVCMLVRYRQMLKRGIVVSVLAVTLDQKKWIYDFSASDYVNKVEQ
jgi:hypothetical protein